MDLVPLGETGETVLENGENEYPFLIPLPENLVTHSSFHYLIGGLRNPEYGKKVI